MKKWTFLVFATMVILLSGCKKDAVEEIKATQMKLIDRLDKLDVPEIMRNSDNTNAQTAVGYVDEVKGIQNYFTWFDVPEDAIVEKSGQLSGGETYFWSYGGASVWQTYTESGSKNIWQIDIDNGTGDGRQRYMYSEEEKDGSYGFLKIYNVDEKSEEFVFMYEWSFDSKDNASLIWKDFAETFVYEIKSNVDLSGYAKWWTSGALLYHFLWNTDGSGSYNFYGDNGEVLFGEAWAVTDL